MTTETGFGDLGPHVPKRATFSGSGATDIVAAVSGKAIRVISMVVSNSIAGTLAFKSASTDIGSIVCKTADPTVVLPRNSDGWLQTVVGEKLAVTPSAGTCTGFITYIEL